jgi:hypothetical protein
MSLKRLLTAATIALATAAITPAAAHANPPGISTETLTALTNLQPQTAWKLCHDGSTDVDTIITGESGDIQVWAKRGQDCKVAVRSERWLRYDRGGPTNGWRQPRPAPKRYAAPATAPCAPRSPPAGRTPASPKRPG